MVLLKNIVELQWGVVDMYITATQAATRTCHARKEDSDVATRYLLPFMMAQIMEKIKESISMGQGTAVYHIPSEYFEGYTQASLKLAKTLMEEKMFDLGYRVVQLDDNDYKFVWLSY